jgi:hypothetical protein
MREDITLPAVPIFLERLAMASWPLGWIAAATVTGRVWLAVMRTLSGATEDRVTVILKFNNTPLDDASCTESGLC